VKWNGLIWTATLVVAVQVLPVAMTAAVSAQQPQQPEQQSAAADQAKIDQGKQTFAQKCSHCHGPNMVNSGTITPDLRRFPNDEPRFTTTVKQGKNGRMPPWGDILNDDDISALWAYVSSRRTP
jgi:mono/diheme cytochrome c family protein